MRIKHWLPIFLAFLAPAVHADICWTQFGSQTCGEEGYMSCAEKRKLLKNCREQERLNQQQKVKNKESEYRKAHQREINAIEKIDSANRKLNPQWEK